MHLWGAVTGSHTDGDLFNRFKSRASWREVVNDLTWSIYWNHQSGKGRMVNKVLVLWWLWSWYVNDHFLRGDHNSGQNHDHDRRHKNVYIYILCILFHVIDLKCSLFYKQFVLENATCFQCMQFLHHSSNSRRRIPCKNAATEESCNRRLHQRLFDGDSG